MASTYDWRADYSDKLLQQVLSKIPWRPDKWALEIGAGTGKLTKHLLLHFPQLIALEPNHSMRQHALEKPYLSTARWIAGVGQCLPIRDNSVNLVAYGSSFNVLPPDVALRECSRVLKPGGSWLALWNHRDLNDPLQQQVEAVILRHLPHFNPGSRRESPAPWVNSHGDFTEPIAHEHQFSVEMPTDHWLNAWQSHATLLRQAGDLMPTIVGEIRQLVAHTEVLRLTYFTRLWIAQKQ